MTSSKKLCASFRLGGPLLLWLATASCSAPYPKGFAPIEEHIPTIVLELRYETTDNFTGRPVRGYSKSNKVLTIPTLKALAAAQKEFNRLGLGLKLYDGYRPQKAVNAFVAWSKRKGDTLTKQSYYPDINKANLFGLGYIASKSGHSRGSTIDVGLIYIKGPQKGENLDMGSPWDFFGSISWVSDTTISATQQKNRQLLSAILQKNGFHPYAKEWWHFTLEAEPFPTTYFDF